MRGVVHFNQFEFKVCYTIYHLCITESSRKIAGISK